MKSLSLSSAYVAQPGTVVLVSVEGPAHTSNPKIFDAHTHTPSFAAPARCEALGSPEEREARLTLMELIIYRENIQNYLLMILEGGAAVGRKVYIILKLYPSTLSKFRFHNKVFKKSANCNASYVNIDIDT